MSRKEKFNFWLMLCDLCPQTPSAYSFFVKHKSKHSLILKANQNVDLENHDIYRKKKSYTYKPGVTFH